MSSDSSLKVDVKSVSEQHPEELRHSLHLHEAVVVDVEVVPHFLESLVAVLTGKGIGLSVRFKHLLGQ